MPEFAIRLRSVQDVQQFVALATSRPYDVVVRDNHNKIDAKCFMEMFCLDFRRPLRVVCQCSEEELQCFLLDAQEYLVK